MAQKQVGSASIAIQKLYDGKSQYIFVKYSKNANGDPMVDNPTAETKYMGIYTSDKNTASTKYSDYSWTQIKGSQGDSAVSGILTDEFIAINTDSEGNNGNFSRATTGILLFEGLFENTKDWTIQVTTTSGVTGTYDAATASYKVTRMAVDSGTITFTAKKGTATVTKKATVQKVKAGADGSDGTDGIGIKSTKITYQISSSGTGIPTGTWVETLPSAKKGEFLWTRTIITYTDNKTSESYTVAFSGTDGSKGQDGSDGLGIKSTSITYQAGTSGTTAPTGTWSTAIPSVSASQYLWTKTETTYTDNSKTNAYSVGKMGDTGAPGASAQLLFLTSDSNVMKFNADGTSSTQTITFVANLQNVTGTATFTATPYIGTAAQSVVTLGRTGNTKTLTNTQWNSNWTSVVVEAKLNSLTDKQTIVKLQEAKDGTNGKDGSNGSDGKDGTNGENAVVGLLTNESITLQANSSGTVSDFSKGTGTFKVYDGITDVAASSSTTFALKVGTGGTFNINASTGVYAITAMTTDTAEATFTATYKGVVIEKTLSVAKSKAGATGASSTSYWLVLSSQVLSLPKGSTSLIPSNFTITPMRQVGTAAAAAFSARIIVDETVDGNTWTNKYSGDNTGYTYTPSSTNVQSIRVQLKLNSSATVILDQKSVNIVRDGINGNDGKDGESSHTWIRYSTNADGNPMTTIPNKDSKYIGIAITSSNTPPTSYTAYTWARIKGDGGLKNRLYTETGANVNQDPIEIFNETQSDGDIVTPENITWYAAKESTNKFTAIGSNKSRNLVRNSSDEWSNPITNFTGIQNYCPNISIVDNINLKSGDIINVYIEVKYDNIVAASGQTASFWLQGGGNKTSWSPGFPSSSSGSKVNNVSGSGTAIFKYTATITESYLANDYWNTAFRCDYIQSGSIQYRSYKVEKSMSGSGGDYTPWTPAPGKTNDIYIGQPNLLANTESSQSTNVDTATFVTFDPYTTEGRKTLSELGYSIGDKLIITTKWSIAQNESLALKYGTFHIEGFQYGVGYSGQFSSKTTFSASNTSGIVYATVTLTETMLRTNGIRFRIDNSTLKFTVDEVKIEPGIVETPWAPSMEGNTGIFLKENSIVVSPNYFLEENSVTFRADVDYQTMRSSDQLTITNKAFDAMKPLILRQPIAPKNPYPGLLWMDTSSDDNYIYRWGKTPREKLNGLKYTHYAYANELEGWKDFSVYYPNRNLIINGSQYTKESPFLNNAKTPDGIRVLPNTYSILKQGSYTFNCETDGNWYAHNTSGTDPALRRANIYLQGTKSGATAIFKGANGKMPFQFTISADEASYTWEIRTNTYGNNTVPSYVNFWNFKIEQGNLKTLYLPSPEDEPDKAYMNFVGTYVDKTPADSLDPNKYTWSTLNDPVNYTDDSGNQGIEEEDFVTVYDWGWIILTEEEKEGIPWLNNEDGSTIIDWIYQITQNTSDSSIINKVIGSSEMKNVYASSDELNELVGSNDELASKIEEYNKVMQNYTAQVNSMYENMTEMKQTMDKFLFNIESAGGVNILRNSTGFQFDDETGDFYKWIKWLNKGTVTQEMGNQSLNDLGFVAGFRFNGYLASLKQDLDLPAPDIEYTLSTYISILNNTPGASRVVVKIVDRDNESLVYGRISTDGADIPASDRFSVTFNSPSTKVRVEIALWTDNTNTSTTASALVAGTMLNIGPFPLSWQSHHEEVYSTNVRMDGSGLKVFNNDYDGYNVMTPKEFAGYYRREEDGDYEKVFTLNKDTTEVKKLRAEERFMMKPIQIVSIESEITPGWAFVGYTPEKEKTIPKWNANILYNATFPQMDNAGLYWPRMKGQVDKSWISGIASRPETGVLRITSQQDNHVELFYRFGNPNTLNSLPIRPSISPGEKYNFSADIRGDLFNNSQHYMQLTAFYTTNVQTNWTEPAEIGASFVPDKSNFDRYSYTFIMPVLGSGESLTRFMVGLKLKTNDKTNLVKTGEYFEFKNAKLETGSYAT